MNTEDYVGSIVIGAGWYIPAIENLKVCDGTPQPISKYNAYYSIVGTVYGGDGRVTVGIPDLRCHTPNGFGPGPNLTDRPLGQIGGVQKHAITLTEAQMPAHTHSASFDPSDLNNSVITIADLANSQFTATLLCDNTNGGNASPQNSFPGNSDAGINTWALSANSTMAADAIIGAGISALNVNTTIASKSIPVNVNDAGDTQTYSAPTALPAVGTWFLIAVDGPYPDRE